LYKFEFHFLDFFTTLGADRKGLLIAHKYFCLPHSSLPPTGTFSFWIKLVIDAVRAIHLSENESFSFEVAKTENKFDRVNHTHNNDPGND